GFPVSQSTTQPTMVYIVLTSASCFFFNCVLCLFFSPNEQSNATVFSGSFHVVIGCINQFNGFLRVDNVYYVTFCEDVFLHFWVPATSLVTKVYAGFKQLFHRDYCHFVFPPIWFFPSLVLSL